YRARHPLRERHSPDCHPLDAPFRGGGRAAGAHDHAQRVDGHCAHRDHPPDWHRQEERDFDDRFCDRGRAQPKQETRGGHLSGMSLAVSTDYDDDDGGFARLATTRDRGRHRRGASPAARNLDRRRPHLFADVDALHDAGRLSLPRPLPALVAASAPGTSPIRQARSGERVVKRRELAFAAVLLGLTGCAVGPNYKRPAAPMSPAFKEQTGQLSVPGSDWKPAEPKDTQIRGNWWEIFADAELNALESQIDVSNQNIAQAPPQFAGAPPPIPAARPDFYPTINLDGSVPRAHTAATATAPAHTGTIYTASADASYEVDVWGRIRRSVESSVATAQASAGDLETVRLSMHAELAIDYFQLRSLDVEKQLLETNVEAYEKALQLTINRYNQGVVSGIDVAQAQTQLENTRAQSTDLGVSRAALEHAIATLIGKTPANFAIERVATVTPVPAIPFGLPSDLLERRPDVAGAERRMAAANAQIGVAGSAHFLQLLLARVRGRGSSPRSNSLRLAQRL